MNSRIVSISKYCCFSISLFFFSITVFGTYKWAEEYFDGKMWLDWESTALLVVYTISGGLCLAGYFLLLGLNPRHIKEIASLYKLTSYIFIFSSVLIFISDRSLYAIIIGGFAILFKESWKPVSLMQRK